MNPFFFVPLETLQNFSHDSRVYRSFDHLILPRHGSLLLVPVELASGDLRSVIDGCPVPWEEVFDVLEAPADSVHFDDNSLLPEQVLKISQDGWRKESFKLALRSKPSRRFINQFGIRFADL